MKTMLHCPCAEIPEDKEPTWRHSETITIMITAVIIVTFFKYHCYILSNGNNLIIKSNS